MEHLTFNQLCQMAQIEPHTAETLGLCRTEVEKLILNQSKN